MNLRARLIGFALLLSLSITPRAATTAHFHTSVGDMDVELFDEEKPITVLNFIRYVQSGRYQNMFFHRCLPNFIVQGGGVFVTDRSDTDLAGAFYGVPSYGQITNEFAVGQPYSNVYGTLAMAKLPDLPDSATSQWFFNLNNNATNLDNQNGGFTVFGRVIQGTSVLDYFNTLAAGGGGIVDMRVWYGPNLAVMSDLPVNYTGMTPPFYRDLFYVDITLSGVVPRYTLATSVTGQGTIAVSPVKSSYAQGSTVTLTATPGPGYQFSGWSGGVTGSTNPASIVMSANQTVTAAFSVLAAAPVLSNPNRGATGNGFGFLLTGSVGAVYEIQSSVDLKTWTAVGTYTNSTGTVPFVDSGDPNWPRRFFRALAP